MDIQTYIEKQGTTLTEFAKGVGVSRSLAYQWVNKIRPVAAHHCLPIEIFTSGLVPRIELRANDWHKFWPDLKPARRKT